MKRNVFILSVILCFELIEKVRFICILSPLIEPQDVEDSLQVAGQRFPGARHCFAYRLRQDGVIMEVAVMMANRAVRQVAYS